MDLKNVEFIMYFILDLLIIFIYGSYRCKNPNYKDILETKIYIGDLDGWSISHLLFFLIGVGNVTIKKLQCTKKPHY